MKSLIKTGALLITAILVLIPSGLLSMQDTNQTENKDPKKHTTESYEYMLGFAGLMDLLPDTDKQQETDYPEQGK